MQPEDEEENQCIYCSYCKDEVTEDDEYVKLKKRIFHVECLQTLRGRPKELRF